MGVMDPINALGEVGVDVLVCGTVCSRRPDPRLLRTRGRPPCTVVVDREDDVRITQTALASHNPAAGHFVVHPTVAPSGRLLWQDILRTLGARVDARAGREAQEDAVRVALRAAGPCQVTVLRAHRLGLGRWADLVHLHRTTPAEFVLVHHAALPRDLAHLLRHCDHRIVDTFTGMARLHPPAPAGPGPRCQGAGPRPFPHVGSG